MTDLRKAAQAVLDACTDAVAGWESLAPLAVRSAALESLDGLRAALEQPAWVCPESPEHRYAKPGHCEDCGRTLVLAQQAEPVEPVAIADGTFNHDCPIGTLLYAAPPQRKPLTDEEIPALAEQVLKLSVYYDVWALLGTDGLVALVRAVERAHGIGEQDAQV